MIILLIKTNKKNNPTITYKTTTFSNGTHLIKLAYLNKTTINITNGQKTVEVLWSNIKEMPLKQRIS